MKLPDSFPHKVKSGNSVVRIYRHENKGREEFKIAFYRDGIRKLESFSDYADAHNRAKSINDSVTNGDLDTLTLTADDRVMYLRSIETLKPTGRPLDKAATEYADAIQKLGNVPLTDAVAFYLKRNPRHITRKTVQQVYAEMLAAKKQDGNSKVYLKDLKFRLGKFAQAFQTAIVNITAGDLNDYLRSMTCSPRGRNNHRMAIGTLLNYAEGQDYLPKEHVDFEKVKRAIEKPTKIEIFTEGEMTKLLAQAGPGLTPFMALGGFAGLRTAEIMRQRWEDINLERGFIRVTDVKGNTAQNRLVPLQPNLKTWLAPYANSTGPVCSYGNITDALFRVAAKAGVKWKHNALRHSYVSCRVAQVQNVAQVSLECGNSIAMIHKHYREVVTPGEATAWFSIAPEQAANVVLMAAG